MVPSRLLLPEATPEGRDDDDIKEEEEEDDDEEEEEEEEPEEGGGGVSSLRREFFRYPLPSLPLSNLPMLTYSAAEYLKSALSTLV